MPISNDSSHEKDQFGITTKILAGICHNCGICRYANKRPISAFGRLMRWHRGWCPAWDAHSKVSGAKSLS